MSRRHRGDPRTSLLIAGYGTRGRTWAAVARRRRAFRLLGVVDPDDAARADAEAAGLRSWARIEDALDREVGACVVASPPALHAEQALAVLDAEAGVLVEKPLALSVADATRVADRAAAAGRPALAGMNFRLRPVERAIRVGLDRIGRPRTSAVHTSRPASARSADGDAAGLLWDFGIHHLDLLVDRAGEQPIAAEAETLARTGEAGGALHRLRLSWESGAVANWIHDPGASLFHTYQWIETPSGGISADGDRVLDISTRRRPRRLRAPRAPSPEVVLLDRLRRALATGDPDPLDARRALGTIATVQAAAEAFVSGSSSPADLLAATGWSP